MALTEEGGVPRQSPGGLAVDWTRGWRGALQTWKQLDLGGKTSSSVEQVIQSCCLLEAFALLLGEDAAELTRSCLQRLCLLSFLVFFF